MKLKINKTTIKRYIYKLRHDYLTTNNVVMAVAFMIAISWAWGSVESMQRNYELQKMVDRKRQLVKLEELRVALLGYESKYYASAEYQDLAVRQRMGLAAPGERQIIVPSTDEKGAYQANKPKQTITPSSNFQQWMDFLFNKKQS